LPVERTHVQQRTATRRNPPVIKADQSLLCPSIVSQNLKNKRRDEY
jgi:hypothetical protein